MNNSLKMFVLGCVVLSGSCIARVPGAPSDDMYESIPSPTPDMKTREDFLRKLPKNGVVAEIGVWCGHFSEMILKYNNPKKLYLIDCWEEQPDGDYPNDPTNRPTRVQEQYYREVKNKFARDPRVEIIRMYSDEAAKLFADETFDWIYIDACHTYKAVKADLKAWYPKVKKGGYVAGDDYAPTVLWNKGIDWASYGIIPAVNEFLRDNQLVMAYMTVAEGHESWAVLKK